MKRWIRVKLADSATVSTSRMGWDDLSTGSTGPDKKHLRGIMVVV